MTELTNIAAMKAIASPTNNLHVYVKGYSTEGDGGGGVFIYKSDSTKTSNYGTIFTKASNASGALAGRWIRQYSGYMNVEYFGVQRDWDAFDTMYPGVYNSDRIQNMIDYATENSIYSKEGDVTLFFPNGQYFIDKPIILKDRVKLLGSPATLLTNKGDAYDYMFKLNKGVVTNLRMENFKINLNEQPGVGGIYFKAAFPVDSSQTHQGGLSDANFKNIQIQSVRSHGIYLEGGEAGIDGVGDSEFLLPNQFIIFENVRVMREDANSNALRITGHSANFTFLNCEFITNPNLKIGGACIYISSTYADNVRANKMGSDAISFINSGFGGCTTYGAVIQYAGNVTFDTCYFEGTDIAFEIKESKQVQILNSRFANCAGNGSLDSSYSHTGGAGRIVSAEKSIVNVWNNRVEVTATQSYAALANQSFILGFGNDNVFNVQNNTFKLPELGKTGGIVQTITIDTLTKTISTWSKKVVFVTAPATYSAATSDINTIKSDINTGETMFVRANGGKIKFNPGLGNLYLNGRPYLEINNGQAATFLKIENDYQLVSIAD